MKLSCYKLMDWVLNTDSNEMRDPIVVDEANALSLGGKCLKC